jgi:hypothetical protein
MKLKKIRLGAIFIFVVGFSFPSFSTNTEEESDFRPGSSSVKKRGEVALAIGFEYGNFWGSFFDDTEKVKMHRNSPAINFHSYGIRNGHTVGLFAHGFLGSPNKGTVNGVQPKYTNWVGLQTGLIIGPLFWHIFNEKFTLLYGAGPSFLVTMEAYNQYIALTDAEESFEKEFLSVGIGTNIMLRYAIGDNMLLFAGCILTYDFLSFVTLESKPSNPALNVYGRAKDFSMLGVRPYVSIGFRL